MNDTANEDSEVDVETSDVDDNEVTENDVDTNDIDNHEAGNANVEDENITVTTDTEDVSDNDEIGVDNGIYQVTMPPTKARIQYRDIGEENWNECVVTGRAGKVGKGRTGKHKIWANVKMVNDGRMHSANFENVEWQYKEESVMLAQNFDKLLMM